MKQQFYNLSNDYLFKCVFSNFILLKQMLRDVFNFDLSGYHFISPRIPNKNKGLKAGECDLVLMNGRHYVIVEMQNRRCGSLENRTNIYMNYFSRLDWQKGDENYSGIYPVTIFWILNYQYQKKDLLEYQTLEKSLQDRFQDGREVKIFVVKAKHEKNILNQYQTLFTAKNIEKLESVKNKNLDIFVQLAKSYNEEPTKYIKTKVGEIMFWKYEDEMKFQRMDAYTEGEKKGVKKGERKAKLETAKNLLADGIPLEVIMKTTKLSKKQIMEYKA